MKDGCKNVAIRICNAEKVFLENLIEQFHIIPEDAKKYFDLLLKAKVIKIDSVGGKVILKDGRFWDKKTVLRILSEN